ncbi:MAG TPA: DUF1552 domain-containing protein [Polyangiales bacterium]|nr:DUF1552 domain-containing protein [Polyangiales bacterium]
MSQPRIHRRSLLQLLGLTTLASLAPRGSLAAAQATVPKRIVFFYTNHGSHRPAWLPVGVGGAAATETAFELGKIHQPLASFKKDLLLVDGLDMLSSDVQNGPAANAHIRGHCHSMTAVEMADANLAGGASIDQHIAQALRKAGVVTALPSLEIGVDPNTESRISFASSSQQLPIEDSPQNTWKRLFPNGATSTAMPATDTRAARKKSVLDFVAEDFAALTPKLSKDDRVKLEAHADLVRDLEKRMSVSAAVSCNSPTLSAAGSRSEYATWYQETGDQFMRLIQAAFACDLTRVVTFNMEAIPDELCGYNSSFGTTDMHDLIHKVAQSSDPLSKSSAAVDCVVRFHTEYSKQFAKLLGYLAAIPEADGTTALQNTIVLWCGEIAEGNHDLHKLPWLIAGQGGGAVRTGRFLQVPRSPEARGHNDLYVALANAMGSPITSFGAADVCKGALPGLS